MVSPVAAGGGRKHLFLGDAPLASFELAEAQPTSSGAVIATYRPIRLRLARWSLRHGSTRLSVFMISCGYRVHGLGIRTRSWRSGRRLPTGAMPGRRPEVGEADAALQAFRRHR